MQVSFRADERNSTRFGIILRVERVPVSSRGGILGDPWSIFRSNFVATAVSKRRQNCRNYPNYRFSHDNHITYDISSRGGLMEERVITRWTM